MRAEIVTIGTEILLGQIVDTNAAKLAQMLKEIGVDLHYKTTVGDNEARIVEVLNNALNRADMVITSGGLGPTVDDITRQGVAIATGRKLVHSPELEAQIAERFHSFGRQMTDNNKRQAYIPEGSRPLPNPVGTAPCFLAEDAAGRGCIISLPGVPHELEHMMANTVIPLLVERMGGAKIIKTRILRTCAVGESNIDRAIGDLMTHSNPTVGLAAHGGHTDVRITVKADSNAEANQLITPMETELRKRLGVSIFGVDDDTIPGVIGNLLVEKGVSVAIIDTLTYGQVYQWLFKEGFGQSITSHSTPSNIDEAKRVTGINGNYSPIDLAVRIAMAVTPANGLGLALIGPFADNTTFIGLAEAEELAKAGGLAKSGQNVHVWPGYSYQDNEYSRRWLTIQGLDWIRRFLLGQLTSPVDWTNVKGF